ncbi:MAG: zinc ribbon domain-containing protein [Eubacteriales bacterium]
MNLIMAIGVLFLTGFNWWLYHKIFGIVYFGNPFREMLKELFWCMFLAGIEIALMGEILVGIFGFLLSILASLFSIIFVIAIVIVIIIVLFYLIKWIRTKDMSGIFELKDSLFRKWKQATNKYHFKKPENIQRESVQQEDTQSKATQQETMPQGNVQQETMESVSNKSKVKVDTMYCVGCGKKINRNIKFCNYCGRKVTYVASEEASYEVY